MKFHIPLDSGRIAIPIRLILKTGERLGRILPSADVATALVISTDEKGGFAHSTHSVAVYLKQAGSDLRGGEWALHGIAVTATLWTYFLNIPDSFFRTEFLNKNSLRSISIQIVGHSPLRSDLSFAGHITLEMNPAQEISLLSRFTYLVDEWLPVLLPERFVAKSSLKQMEIGSGIQNVLIVSLHRPEDSEAPLSFHINWEPSEWIGAVIESTSLFEKYRSNPCSIKGGCFLSAEGELSHWFGRNIGLELAGFRQRAAEQLTRNFQKGLAAWCFWIEPLRWEGEPNSLETPTYAEGALRVRHPVLGLAWNVYKNELKTMENHKEGYKQAMDLLRDAARLRVFFHEEWEKLGAEHPERLWKYSSLSRSVERDTSRWDSLASGVQVFYSRYGSLLGQLADYQVSKPNPFGKTPNPLAVLAEFAAQSLERSKVL